MATRSEVLRRIARPPAPPQPLTPARALRLAMVRAAERSVGLPLSVGAVTEEEGPLDDRLGRLEEGLLLLELRRDGCPIGLAAVDAEARSAAVEAQMLGAPAEGPSEPREVTAADVALTRPLIDGLLLEIAAATEETSLAGWLDGAATGGRFSGTKAVATRCPDGRYREVRLELEIGTGARRGLILLLAKVEETTPAPDARPEARLADQVLAASVPVEAVLHRLRLPLEAVERLQAGQVLPLPGVTVASVRLEAGGRALGAARLGQVAGLRAVRVEEPLAPRLEEIAPPREVGAPAGLPLPLSQDASAWPSNSWPGAMSDAGPAPPDPLAPSWPRPDALPPGGV